MTTPANTFRVLADALPFIEKKLETAAKKAVKLGFTAPTLNILQWVNVKDESGVTRYVEISVEGEAPKLNGWTFVASLQVLGEESVIRTALGQTLPSSYREADPTRCEHCNLSRRRNDTFVLVHDSGEAKQVGRTCLRDFLGHLSPETVARYADLLFKLRESCEAAGSKGWYGTNGSATRYFDLTEFLAATVAEIRANGWVSATMAKVTNEKSTARIVWDRLESRTENLVRKYDRMFAEEAQEWAEALPEEAESDYLHNVRVIAGFGAVEHRLAGYAGSIIVAFKRAQDEAKRASRSVDFIGTVGKEETFTLKFLGATQSARGTCYIARFEDERGSEAVYWPKSDPKFIVGRTYTVRAKVKGHETFRGVKNTTLGNVLVTEVFKPTPVEHVDNCPF